MPGGFPCGTVVDDEVVVEDVDEEVVVVSSVV